MENLNDTETIIRAHKSSSNHRSSIIKDKLCGCFIAWRYFPLQKFLVGQMMQMIELRFALIVELIQS